MAENRFAQFLKLADYWDKSSQLRFTDFLRNVVYTPVTVPTATTALTTLTHTAPSTPDYAIQDLVNAGPYGFVTKDEGNTVLKVVAHLQARVAELESIVKNAGLEK